MKNIRKNVNRNFKLRLNYDNYLDVQLALDNYQCLVCDDIISGDVVTSFGFDSISGMCSEVDWEHAVSFSGDVCDIGLTGYDNRFVPNFSGETWNPSGETSFCVKRVSGDTFCYDMNYVEATESEPKYIQYCGGFHQGFYKLHELDYSVLPPVFYKGWTKEFWIKPEDCPSGEVVQLTGESVYYSGDTEIVDVWQIDYLSGGTCASGVTLNDVYPDNKGIFYYWGTRAENKFCLFSPLSGLTTCTGNPLAPTGEVVEFEPENSFLYYNRKIACEPKPNPTLEYTDCCGELINNSLAFRITDDGEVGVRILTTTGECAEVDGHIKWVDNPIMEEYYSDEGIVQRDRFNHVAIRFEPYDKSECLAYRRSYGILSIYVDGFLKLRVANFPEIIPYELNEHKDKQLGVPFNISLGGGTQGLLEAYPEDLGDFFDATGYTACDYYAILVEPCIFNGISLSGEVYESPELTIDEPELIETWLEMTIGRRVGNISVTPTIFNKKKAIKIELNGIIDTLDYIVLANQGLLTLCNPTCYDVPPHDGKCGYLEEYFAGTFIGGIAEFRLHERPLCLDEVRCNFNQEKRKYNRHKDKPECK